MTVHKNIVMKTRSRRGLAVDRRDKYALNALDRYNLKLLTSNIATLAKAYIALKNHAQMRCIFWKIILGEVNKVLNIVMVEAPAVVLRQKHEPMNFQRMENMLRNLQISCSERYINCI